MSRIRKWSLDFRFSDENFLCNSDWTFTLFDHTNHIRWTSKIDAPRNAVLSILLPLPPSLASETKQHIANRNARQAINSTLATTRHSNSPERRAINSTLATTRHSNSQSTAPLGMQLVTWSVGFHMYKYNAVHYRINASSRTSQA